MARSKVREEQRQRIAKACLDCQASKQKCDGKTPCLQCLKRGRSNSCAYSTHERSYGRQRKPTRLESLSPSAVQTSPRAPDRTPSRGIRNDPEWNGQNSADITVPKLPHHLYDVNGRVLYLGDCAALSFLQHIQELIEGEKELATVAADVADFPVYEEMPPGRDNGLPSFYSIQLQDIQDLIEVFFTSTCGILDIIEQSDMDRLLSCWACGSLEADSGSASVFFLAIAYAAQARSATATDLRRAQSFYDRGRRIAALELTNDPRIETVQAFILISLFMLGCSRRNGAYLNLGIAISAAKSLGLHRDETNAEFSDSEGSLRKRIWRTLRYHDLFFCAMMGRTSAIFTTDSTVLEEEVLTSDPSCSDSCQELGLLESMRAFSFLERTVNDVYTKQNVPLGLLQQISKELQSASSTVPAELRSLAASDSPTTASGSMRHILRNASVACNYYFSMMLLTRPFLITCLRAKHGWSVAKLDGKSSPSDVKIYADITQGATASVDSATKTIQLLHELMTANMLFNNMPLVVAWTFVAALTVCSAYFGRLGLPEECEHAIQQADEILDHFVHNSPQAKRYRLILEKLSRAAVDYVKHLEQKNRAANNKLMPEIFRLHPAQASGSDMGSRVSARSSRPPGYGWPPAQHSPDNQGSTEEQGVIEPDPVTGGSSSGQPDVAQTTRSEATSLLDLAHAFHIYNNPSLDVNPDLLGEHISESMSDFERTDSIWDLSWGGAML